MISLCVFAGWAHVVCALYIPEVEFANVSTMEPIVLQSVPHERYNKVTTVYTINPHAQCNYLIRGRTLHCVLVCADMLYL